MGNFLRSIFSPSHKRTIALLALLLVIVAVPLTVIISQQQQDLRQRASGADCNLPFKANSACAKGGICGNPNPFLCADSQMCVKQRSDCDLFSSSASPTITPVKISIAGQRCDNLGGNVNACGNNEECVFDNPTCVFDCEGTCRLKPTFSTGNPECDENPDSAFCNLTPPPKKYQLTNQYSQGALNEIEYDKYPGTISAQCDRKTDCVFANTGDGLCAAEGADLWICSNNKWDRCDSDDLCDEAIIGTTQYYCNGTRWTTTKPLVSACNTRVLSLPTNIPAPTSKPIQTGAAIATPTPVSQCVASLPACGLNRACTFDYTNQTCGSPCASGKEQCSLAGITACCNILIACPLKSKGDANCDGKIDILDFKRWKEEFINFVATKSSDFNNDATIDILDFSTWATSMRNSNLPH